MSLTTFGRIAVAATAAALTVFALYRVKFHGKGTVNVPRCRTEKDNRKSTTNKR